MSEKLKKIEQSHTINRRIVLDARPVGVPKLSDFHLEEIDLPLATTGQVLLRTLYLSLDPYMRGRMNEGASYAPPVALDEVMVGATISQVLASLHPQFKAGDIVLSQNGWQDYAVAAGDSLRLLEPDMAHPTLALGVLGMPGFTAYMGLLEIGKPLAGETVVVAAASGAVGSAVGQIAKLQGCRAVGIAGGASKCHFVFETLGLNACIDHQRIDFPELLAAACPQGVDIYFESVGGAVFDTVLPLLNPQARIPVCGLISHYNDLPAPQDAPYITPKTLLPSLLKVASPALDRVPQLMQTILSKRIKMQGFIIFDDYRARFPEFHSQMSTWLDSGQVKYCEDIVDGLENAPQAFIGLLAGKNFGKLIIRVANPTP